MTKVWLMCKGPIPGHATPMLPHRIFDSLPELDNTWSKRKVTSNSDGYFKEDEMFRYSLVEWPVLKGGELI